MLPLGERVNDLLEGAMASVQHVLHIPFAMEQAQAFTGKDLSSEMCVLVGFTGEIEGQMIIDGGTQTFGNLGAGMFGMAMEGEMLHSFVGEIANMLAGNICTYVSQKERKVDITPPTILMGEMKLFSYQKGFSVAIDIQEVGKLTIILLLQEDKAG